jgi:DNA-binding PadR family transcriptional regulator
MASILGELETMVLVSVATLGDGAYGAAIRRDVSQRLGRDYSVGAIYATLQRLEEKGLLRSNESDPLPVRGGRSRRYFRTTAGGREALRRSVQARTRFWRHLAPAARHP